MSKKHKKKLEQKKTMEAGGRELPGEALSSRGKKTILLGIAILVAGFFVLSWTDPAGRNWAAQWSPFLILGAYGVIAWGIFLPDPPPPGSAPSL